MIDTQARLAIGSEYLSLRVTNPSSWGHGSKVPVRFPSVVVDSRLLEVGYCYGSQIAVLHFIIFFYYL